jgi:hypothetical protein
MTDLFLVAAQKKYRFPSTKGDLVAEQLFDLPLLSANGANLDNLARTINNQLKAVSEESFVTPSVKANVDLTNKLEIVKAVIKIKQDLATAAAERVAKAEKRRRILDALAAQDEKALTTASRDDLEKQLAALDD